MTYKNEIVNLLSDFRMAKEDYCCSMTDESVISLVHYYKNLMQEGFLRISENYAKRILDVIERASILNRNEVNQKNLDCLKSYIKNHIGNDAIMRCDDVKNKIFNVCDETESPIALIAANNIADIKSNLLQEKLNDSTLLDILIDDIEINYDENLNSIEHEPLYLNQLEINEVKRNQLLNQYEKTSDVYKKCDIYNQIKQIEFELLSQILNTDNKIQIQNFESDYIMCNQISQN